MNYCPNCGTANRDGSRFCNECGHKLPSKTGIICPMCSHVNPNDNVYCDNCKARLVPAAPPATPPAAATPAAAPAAPIKKGLSLPVKPADESVQETEAQPEPEIEGDETPDWLVRLRAAAPKASETRPEAPAQLGAQSAPPADEMPDWMRPADSEVPDWFQRLSEPTPVAPTSPSVSPPPSPTPVDEELPDWMRDLGLTTPAPTEEAGPDWLAQMQGPAVPPAPAETEAPGWLDATGATPPPTESPGVSAPDWLEQPAASSPEADVPDWLRQIQGEAAAPATPVEPAAPASATEEPDWLASLRAESELPTQQPAAGEPDWLSTIRDQSGAGTAYEEAAAEEPDWLAGLRDQPQMDVTSAEPATQADVPDWLLGMNTPAVEQPPSEETEAPILLSAEVPDWLRDTPAPPQVRVSPAQAAPTSEDVTSPPLAGAIGAFLGADVGVDEPAETPAWLTDIGTPPPATPPTVQEAAPVELPTWLRDLGPVPTAPAQPEGAPFGEAAAAVHGEIPEWLRGMQPGQATPAFADESGRSLAGMLDQAAAPEAGLEAATIPTWLQALRPTETMGPLAEPAGGVVETEGMLAELQNVLPASAFMGQSHGPAPMRQIQVPGADLARAGLFQELLSRGALAPTVVKPVRSRTARLSERVARWLIAFVLIAAVAVPNGSTLVQTVFTLAEVDAGMYLSAADQVEALQAGDRVLIAFDYDAFQAGEMDAIAQAFLTHIQQRNVEVLAVSLSPTGLALADRVSRGLGFPDATFIDRRYLPGQAAGAQSALISAQADPFDLIVVLAGSPDALRWWIEQATLSGAPTPIVAGVSAGVLPQARLYAQSAQVTGIVAGMMGGLAYQRAKDAEPDAGDDALGRSVRAEGLYLSQLAFAVILIVGAVVSLVTGAKREA